MFKKILAGIQVFALLVAPVSTFGIAGPVTEPTIYLNTTRSVTGSVEGTTALELSIQENTTFVADITAQTASSSDALTDVVLSSADAEFFEIIGDEVHFKEVPDFEDPQDNPATYGAALDNIYRVGFRLTHNGETAGININVEVLDVEEVPTIAFGDGEDLEFTAKNPAKFLEQLELIDSNYTIDYTGGEDIDLFVIFTAPDNNSPLKPTFSKTYSTFPNVQSVEEMFIDEFAGDFAATGTHTYAIGVKDDSSSVNQTVTVTFENTPPVINYNAGDDFIVTAKTKQALIDQLTATTSLYSVTDFDDDVVEMEVTIELSEAAALMAGTSTVVQTYMGSTDINLDIETELLGFAGTEIATGTYVIVVNAQDDESDASNAPQTITINIENTAPEILYEGGGDVEFTVANLDQLSDIAQENTPDYEVVDFDQDELFLTVDVTGPGISLENKPVTLTDNSVGIQSIIDAYEQTLAGAVPELGQYEIVVSVTDTEATTTQSIVINVEETETEVVVRPNDLGFGDPAVPTQSWYFVEEQPGSATPFSTDEKTGDYEMVVGPNPVPLGEGSVRFEKEGTERWGIATNQFAGTQLATIQEFKFSTYNSSDDESNNNFFFNFDVDFDGETTNGYQGRLVFTPSSQSTAIVEDQWQEWDMTDGVWGWSGYAGAWPDTVTDVNRPWAEIVEAFPNAEFLFESFTGQTLVRAGGSNSEDAPTVVAYTDNVVVKANNVKKTFDFEPKEATLEITDPNDETEQVIASEVNAFSAVYLDNDAIVDEIKWAVRFGTCQESTSTVAGNVDGKTDTAVFDPETGEFVMNADLSEQVSGTYCLVVNPQEQQGEPDLRETEEFFLKGLINSAPVIEYNDGDNLDLKVKDLEQLLAELTASTSDFVISDIDGDNIVATTSLTLSGQAAIDYGTTTFVFTNQSTEESSTITVSIEDFVNGALDLGLSTGTYVLNTDAQDEQGATSSSQTITVVVTGETKPEFTSFAGAESTSVTFELGDPISVQTEAVDEDGDEVVYAKTTGSSALFAVGTSTGLITANSAIPVGTYNVIVEVRNAQNTEDEVLVEDEDEQESEQIEELENDFDQADDTQSVTIVVQNSEIEEETNTSSSGGGGTRYVCKDEEATNYSSRGRSDPDLCKYEEDESEPESELEEPVVIIIEPTATGGANTVTPNPAVPAGNQVAFGTNAGVVQAGTETEQENQSGVDEEDQAATSTVNAESEGEITPNQSANIFGALSGGESCEEKGMPWPWIVGLLALLIAGVIGRIFANPGGWIFKLLNNVGALTITGLVLLALWVVLNGCANAWYVPAGIIGSWIAALFTRDTGA